MKLRTIAAIIGTIDFSVGLATAVLLVPLGYHRFGIAGVLTAGAVAMLGFGAAVYIWWDGFFNPETRRIDGR